MNQYHDYHFYRSFMPDLRLDLFHVTEGRHDYDRVHTFLFNILAFYFEAGGDDNEFTEMDTGRIFRPGPGEGFFIPSYTKGRYFQRASCRFVAMHFGLTFLSGFDLFRESRQIRLIQNPELFREVADIFSFEQENLNRALRLEALILKLCAEWLPEGIDERKREAGARWSEVFAYIREHLDATLEVARVAAYAKSTPDAFSHRFSDDLGISPKQFIQQELVRKLSVELTRKGVSIKELAERFHFCSEFYFSTFFKRQTGFSPSQYRKRFSLPESRP